MPSADDEAACPLLVVGSRATFVDDAAGQSIEIVAQDATHAEEVRARAKKLLAR